MASILALTLALPGLANAGELGAAEKACLKCHNDPKIDKKKLENGETLSMYISEQGFVDSMHNETSCEDCHSEIDNKSHPKVKSKIANPREMSFNMRESCRECHKKKFKEYEDSVHAAMVKGGSSKAPVCSDCHNPHTVQSRKIARPITETPCAKCHKDIFNAYSKDVHGLDRVAKGKEAPICYDCHQAHGVKAAVAGEAGIKDACFGCHKNAVEQHKAWLPNAGLHFEAISCPTCHVPNAKRRVNLRLYDAIGNKQLAEKSGIPRFEKHVKAADAKNEGLDERALWSLLRDFSEGGAPNGTILRGRLEVASGVEAHQIAEKGKAIKDCAVCHQVGAEPFQSVSISIAGPDGRPLRHGVSKEVLSSLTALESVRGFYAIGGTRIKELDILLVLVLLGSVGGPLAHLAIRIATRGYREKRRLAEQEANGGKTH